MEKVFNKRVVAVTATYNRKELLRECIEAVLGQNYENCDILVVDNNSTDGTFEYIEDLLKNKRVIYKKLEENLGSSGGFNYGIREAYNLGYDYIWILDNDCIVKKTSLEAFIEADKKLNGEYGFLASKVLWKDGSICKMNIPKKTFSRWLKDFDKSYQTIEMASFVSLFVNRSIVKEFGLPIKEFFIWSDDWEYTRRISRKYKSYYITESEVVHKSESNIGADISIEEGERLQRFKYLYRNDRVLYRGEGIKGEILLRLRLCKHLLKILKNSKKDKMKRIKIMLDATKSGRRFKPNIEYLD